jgi:predicted transcriptional regulator
MPTKALKVADVMHTNIHMISGLATVQDAIDRMGQLKVSSLVIERRDEGDEYGVITVHDIAAKVVAVNRSTARTSVYEIMRKPAMTVSASMNVKYAIRLLAQLKMQRALVVGNDELVGIVTQRDLVLNYVDGDGEEAAG